MKAKYLFALGLLSSVSYTAMALEQHCIEYYGTLTGTRCAVNMNDLGINLGYIIIHTDVNAGTSDGDDTITLSQENGMGHIYMPYPLAADGFADLYFNDALELDITVPNGLDMEGGDDTLTNVVGDIIGAGSLAGNINLGTGNDTVILQDYAYLGGTIDAGDDNDSVSLINTTFANGTVVIMGSGNDTGIITSSTVNGDIFANEGSDELTVNGTTLINGNIYSGDGESDENLIEMYNQASVNGNINGGTGIDNIYLYNEAAIIGDTKTGANDDVMELNDSASVALVNMEDGSDALTINGADVIINGTLDGGDDISSADGWVDVLTFNNWSGSAPDMINWETIQLNASLMDLGDSSNIVVSDFNIDASSVLTAVGGPHVISGNVDNLGTIDMSDNNPTGGLTVGGNYTGSGTLVFDVNLANEQSDILTVGGDVNAQGIFDFNRVGDDHAGGGASILVIDAPNDDQSTVSTFQFDASVGGSAYVWALVNVPGQGFFIGYNQSVDPGTSEVNVLPGVPAYAALPTIGRELALSQISTLHDRLGELRRLDGWIGSGPQNIQTAMGRQWSNQFTYIPDSWNFWAKGLIGGINLDGGQSYQLDGNYGGFDLGVDRKFTTNRDDFIIYGGLFGGYRTGDFSTDGTSDNYANSLIDADIDIDTWSIGGYATLFWNNTSFLDLVAKYMSFDANISNDSLYINENTTLASYSDSIGGDGFALSAEYGHRIDLADDWILEPQIQLTYLSLHWDDVRNSTYDVQYDNGHYFTGRAGLRLERTFEIDENTEFKPWLRANILQEFGDAVTVDINNSAFDSYKLGTYAQFDIGATYVANDTFQIYGSGNYRTDFSDYNSYEAAIGLRVSW